MGRCGKAEGIVLLGLYHFDSSWRVTLGFVVRWLGERYTLCVVLFVCYGKQQDWWTVGVVDRVQW